MKLLIIGYSDISQRKILPALCKIDNVTEIEIASQSKFVPLNGKVTHFYTSYLEALEQSTAEVVYISLPNSLHFEYAVNALNCHKHVIIDKPSILNNEQLEVLISIANNNNLSVSDATVYFYHKLFDRFKNFSSDKKGVLISTFTVPSFKNNNFRNSMILGGGAVNDMAAYASSIGMKFWDTNSKFIKMSIEKIDGFENSFSILANYGEGKDMIGYFGFNRSYSNNVTFINQNHTAVVERIFSAPENYKTEINILDKGNNLYEVVDVGMDDSFYNFFLFLLEKLDKNNYKLLNSNFYNSNLEALKILEFKNR